MPKAEGPDGAAGRAGLPRILLCVHSAKAGGAERMALAEAEYLKQRFEVTISIPDGPLRQSFGLHAQLISGTGSMPLWGASAHRWLLQCVRTLTGAVFLARAIRRSRIDLVVTNSSVLMAPVLAARLAKVPVIVHARDVPASRLAPLVFKLHGLLAHTVIVIAGSLQPCFTRPGRARVAKIPDGVNTPAAPHAKGPAASGDTLRLCLIGGVDPRKGQDIAVDALARLRDSGLPAVLDLVGREIDSNFAAAVRRRAERLAVAPQVRFLGELADVRPHLAEVDIVIAPSRAEWTPLALMEAMAQQKPVVAADVGGVREVISDRRTGLLIPPEDPSRLASAVSEIAADRDGAARMAWRARRHVEARFSIDATLAGLEAEIRHLLPRDGTSSRGRSGDRRGAAELLQRATGPARR